MKMICCKTKQAELTLIRPRTCLSFHLSFTNSTDIFNSFIVFEDGVSSFTFPRFVHRFSSYYIVSSIDIKGMVNSTKNYKSLSSSTCKTLVCIINQDKFLNLISGSSNVLSCSRTSVLVLIRKIAEDTIPYVVDIGTQQNVVTRSYRLYYTKIKRNS